MTDFPPDAILPRMRSLTLLACLFLSACNSQNGPAPEPIAPETTRPDDGWRDLFNGKDLTGWNTKLPECWKFVDGVLVGESNEKMQGDIMKSTAEFDNFALEAETRFADNIDSGFMYGKPELQVQLGVSRSLKKDMTCSIYYKGKYPGQAQGVDKLLKLNEWNTVRMEKVAKVTKVWLNGQHVLTWECPDEVKAGPIGLQIHGNVKMKVEFRNVKAGAIK